MTTIVTGVRLQVENAGAFTSALSGVKSELNGVSGAERGAATAATDVSRNTRDMAAAADAAAAAMRSATAATKGMGGGFSTTANEIGKSSGLARHHVQNLAFQANDLGIQLAAASQSSEPFKMAMMAIFQQGTQITQIMSQAEIGVGGLLKQVGKFAIAAAPFIAAGAAIAAGFGLMTSEINKNSAVTVTWQDTALGAYDAVKKYLSDQLAAAFEAFGVKTSDVWAKVVDVTKWAINWMIGSVTAVPRLLITAFKVLPAALGDVFYSAVNAAIGAINGLVEQAVSIINGFSALVNPILEKVGLSVPTLLAPKIAPLRNAYAGAAATAAGAFFETLKATVTTDYLGNAAAAISPFAQARARKRLADDAKKAGKEAGAAAGKDAGEEFSRAFQEAMKDAGQFADEIGKTLAADLKKQTAGMWADIATQQAEASDRIKAAAQANAEWNDQLRETIGLLDEIGGFGKVLGDLGAAVVALRTGDFSGLRGAAGTVFKSIATVQWSGSDDQGHYTRTLGDVLSKSLDKVFGMGGSFERVMQNAGLGMSASRLVLGESGSGLGGAIGGALGSKLGEKFLSKGFESIAKGLGSFAGPLGGIAGGILGGVIGGLFKSTKTGGASIGLDAKGNAGITGTGGNSADLKKTASGYAGTVVSALDQIAQALGADLGQFNVAIGKRSSGYIKVSSTGNVAATTAKKPGSDIIYDGKDEGEAIMAALADAIGDGAIDGVSAAVQKALTSSTDVDKALKEALKVQDVELALGGVGAQMAKEFRAFEQQAKDRVRIAREYGFDVLQMEERNAADRLKLQEKLLRDQVGGLQDLIAEMTAGSLFEGSAIDQRDKLMEEIDKAQKQAAAGEEGAADKLAQLLQKLNEVSKEAFGTTGGFAADRATILATAQAEVTRAKQEIEKAQATTDPALAETNDQLSEVNDQLARLAALMGVSVEHLQAMSQQWNFVGFDRLSSLSDLARTS